MSESGREYEARPYSKATMYLDDRLNKNKI